MAEDLAPDRPLVAVRRPSRSERARRAAYRYRFGIIYFCLAAVVGAAVGAFVVVISKPDEHTSKADATKAFAPSSTGEVGAMELAARIARSYRKEGGGELVNVVATRNTLQDGSLGLLRVRFQVIQPVDAAKDRDSRLLQSDDAIQYSLCGTSANCAIPGPATAERGALLRREALELALRTLQTDNAVDSVAVFLRPVATPAGSDFEGYVLLLNRNLLEHINPELLGRPVATLPGAAPTMTPANMTAARAARLSELTQPYIYLYRYQVIGGHDAVMQLQPLAA